MLPKMQDKKGMKNFVIIDVYLNFITDFMNLCSCFFISFCYYREEKEQELERKRKEVEDLQKGEQSQLDKEKLAALQKIQHEVIQICTS